MEERRSTENRIGRLETNFARLDERLKATSEERKEYRGEVSRRLAELNNHSAKLEAEREFYLSKDTYDSRHREIEVNLENRARELATTLSNLSQRFETRLAEHDRDDQAQHREDSKRLKELEDYKTREEANIETRRDAMNRNRWIFGIVITVLNTVLWFLLHSLTK